MAEAWSEQIVADIERRYRAQAEQDVRDAQQAEASGYLGPEATAKALEELLAALPEAEQAAIEAEAARLVAEEQARRTNPEA
jgi:hypothetical protein